MFTLIIIIHNIDGHICSSGTFYIHISRYRMSNNTSMNALISCDFLNFHNTFNAMLTLGESE